MNVCVCVCICNIKPMLLISGRKCQASVEFSGRSSYYEALKRVEKCLRLLVMPPHSSCSHRWRASYYQQEVSWHLPIFSATIMLHNLSLFLFPLSLAFFLPKVFFYLTLPYHMQSLQNFLKLGFTLTSSCIFYSTFSNLVLRRRWQTTQPSNTAGIHQDLVSRPSTPHSFIFPPFEKQTR